MHECCKAVNELQAMTSVMSLYSISFFLHSYTHSRAKRTVSVINIHCAHFIFSHFNNFRVVPPHGSQGYPTTRLRHETRRQQGLFPRPYRKTTNILCDGHRLYNHIQNSYAQSEVQLVAWYYMFYSSMHNMYPIDG